MMNLYEFEVVVRSPQDHSSTETKMCIVLAPSVPYAKRKVEEKYKDQELLVIIDTGNRDVIEI